MKKGIMAALVLALLVETAMGAKVYGLYTDHRAMQLGDLLTVIIYENAEAGTKTSTQTKTSTEFGVANEKGSGLLDFIPGFGAKGGAGSEFDGKGDTQREGKLVAKVSARIEKVLDNGNLLIEGSKLVNINDEQETIKVTGYVRPEDIEANNTIYSYNIADANITYSGKGVNDEAQKPGIFSRFFNWLF